MRAFALPLLALCVAFLAGCERPPKPKVNATVAAQPAADEALTEKVKTAVASDASLQPIRLEVDCNGGVVRLRGTVEDDDTKKRVHELAQSVPGVKWVHNQIAVTPRSG